MISIGPRLAILFLFLVPIPLAESVARRELIVWNVGQGSWTTLMTPSHCHHFDAGGEIRPGALKAACSQRKNTLALSHWDRDHIQFAPWLIRNTHPICLTWLPVGDPKPTLLHVASAVRSMKRCAFTDLDAKFVGTPQIRFLQPIEALELEPTPNRQSQVFEVMKIAVIAGDSGVREERTWSRHLKTCPPILVLGHHGSRTSTSEELLARMKCLKIAVASSRLRKYGHPHPSVVERVRRRGVPTLSTEHWGHLRIEL